MSTNPHTPQCAAKMTDSLFKLEKYFLDHQVAIEAWFRQQWQKTPPPFYSSVDLRNARFKLAPVDTNLFPAGFNNLNPELMPLYVQAVQATIAEICPDVTRLLIIPESHSRNVFYFQSLHMLREILQTAGFQVRMGSLDSSLTEPFEFELPSGETLTIEPLRRKDNQVGVEDFFPCCVILNNDLSGSVPDILEGVSQTIMPAPQLGWATRLKSGHFMAFEEVSREFSELSGMDPWLISPLFDQCPEVNFLNKEGVACLVERAEVVLRKIRKKYKEHQIDEKPFLVVKADAGTYGMGVMMIQDPSELQNLNRKQRTRMSTAKGGVPITKMIIQEGVHSFETAGKEKSVAEPVVYSFGRHVVGGFYRIHKNRGPNENLNAPGMDFVPLAFKEACNVPCSEADPASCRFYVYGVIARLASLAAARELIAFTGEKK